MEVNAYMLILIPARPRWRAEDNWLLCWT